MSETTEPVAGLEARYAALRQAARSEGGDPGDVLEAAFTELEGAIDLLRAVAPVRRDEPSGTPSDAERGLLRAVFQDAPVPQFLVARDGTVQRVNRAAGDMIGAKPGYATGRPFIAFVALPSRAAVNSQLTAVGRTGKPRRIRCSLVAGDGLVPCELVIGRVSVKGNPDEADPLLIAVRDAPAVPVPDAETPDVKTTAKPQLGAVQAITRRLDLVTAVARLLLEEQPVAGRVVGEVLGGDVADGGRDEGAASHMTSCHREVVVGSVNDPKVGPLEPKVVRTDRIGLLPCHSERLAADQQAVIPSGARSAESRNRDRPGRGNSRGQTPSSKGV